MLQFSLITTQIHRCLQEKDLAAFKHCVQQIEGQYGSLIAFASAIDAEFKDQRGFIQLLLEDTAYYSSVDILEYLILEKNIPLQNKSTLLGSALIAEQPDTANAILKIADGNDFKLEGLLNSYIIFIYDLNINNKELKEALTLEIKKQINPQNYEALIQTICQRKVVEETRELFQNAQVQTLQAVALLQTLASELSKQVNGSMDPLVIEGIQPILERLNLLCRQMLLQKNTVHLLRISLYFSIQNYKNQVLSQVAVAPNLLELIEQIQEIINMAFAERRQELKKIDLINQLLSDTFYSLSDSIQTGDIDTLTKAFADFEKKGVSVQKLNELYAAITNQQNDELIMGVLSDASLNHKVYDYLAHEKKLQCSDLGYQALFLKAVRFNQVEIVRELLASNTILSNFIAISYPFSLLNEDGIITSLLLEKVNDQSAENAQTLIRLRKEFKQNALNQLSTGIGSVQRHLETCSVLLENCTVYFQTSELNSHSIKEVQNSFEELKLRLEILRRYMKENQCMSDLLKLIVELLAVKLSILVKNHGQLSKNPQLMGLMQNLVKNLSSAGINEAISIPGLDEMPENLKTQILRELGESAIDETTNEEHGLYHEMRSQYESQFQEICKISVEKKEQDVEKEKEKESEFHDVRAVDAIERPLAEKEKEASIDLTQFACYPILQDLEKYLISQFKKANLQQVFNSHWTHEELKPYYVDRFHTTWRYLFCRPNPWLALNSESNIKWTHQGASVINDADIELIAYFWLAASDDKAPCTNHYSIEMRKEHFAEQLAWFGREYNNEDSQDDLEGDKPTCNSGVRKRAYQLLIGHPLLDQIKELTPEIFIQHFQQVFIAENESHDTLFNRLNAVALPKLKKLQAALEAWILNCGDVDEHQQALLRKYLELDIENALENVYEHFVDKMMDEFGKHRLNSIKVSYQSDDFSNYSDFLGALLCDPLKYFVQNISNKIDTLVERQSQEQKEGRSFVPSFGNHKKRQHQDENAENKKETKEDKLNSKAVIYS